MSIFKTVVNANQVEAAVRDTLRTWFNTYLRETELQWGIPSRSIPEPLSYIIAQDNAREAEDQLPAVVIVSPGLSDEPLKEGDGTYRAPWQVGIGIFASAKDRSSTEQLIRYYCAVIRAIMLQKRSLGGFADNVVWSDESYDELDFDDERTISAGLVDFIVEVAGVVDGNAGPTVTVPPDPDTLPGSNWPLVTDVIITEEVKSS